MTLLYVLGSAVVCGLLGMYAGSRNTNLAWRRWGIALLVVLNAEIVYAHWSMLFIMSMVGALSMGYGVPDETDDGSKLGAFFYRLTKKNHWATDMLTRGTVGIMVAFSCIPLPLYTGEWVKWFVISFLIVGSYVLYGPIIENEPVIHTKKYTFLIEDFLLYFSATLPIFAAIWWF